MQKNPPKAIPYEEFERRALEIIDEMPPAPDGVEPMRDHTIMTECGPLHISVNSWAVNSTNRRGKPVNGWVACCFGDLEQAKAHQLIGSKWNDRLNRHSGKWNWNCFDDDDPDLFFTQFRGALDAICKDVPGWRGKEDDGEDSD